jgi:hypothetical protein
MLITSLISTATTYTTSFLSDDSDLRSLQILIPSTDNKWVDTGYGIHSYLNADKVPQLTSVNIIPGLDQCQTMACFIGHTVALLFYYSVVEQVDCPAHWTTEHAGSEQTSPIP